tara:strand:- start:837 stop:974 length:138 start_codon:yes stop_codon:yes gene_type:complete
MIELEGLYDKIMESERHEIIEVLSFIQTEYPDVFAEVVERIEEII